ncbi:Z1 domain-containing protein [Sphaerisporangium dianthi]|uniref:Z1 domain-containing protein n=1 Tax=Sphaerisporangium dianthi TaxID=1436120 RepID=A0ABV9CPD4_9ACTN
MADAYLAALDSMHRSGPRDLHSAAQFLAADTGLSASDGTLHAYLRDAGPNDPLRMELRTRTATWDNAVGPAWAEGSPANTVARRNVIIGRLKLNEETAALFDELFPIAGIDLPTVIAPEWTPWYTSEIRNKHAYYWKHYADYLKVKGWTPEAISSLDIASDRVVERLADPTQREVYQAKGLVIGYVQSGKTANFTGVLAKAIDVGYRLVIVLTGTTDLLRAQTQRRLDMELVGVENILGGIDPDDAEALDGVDYQGEADWISGKFVRHGSRPREAGRPNIHRLTTQRGDYKSLQQGITALDFPRKDETRPVYDPVNLFSSDARVAVVKKNGSVLTKLVRDLKKSAARMEDVPVLIVDDESDQASVNTSNPKNWKAGRKERSAINQLIAQLLGMLPRAQYVGYTATPFANVFVDPSDAEDIFPKDFLISLPRALEYMGAKSFHDIDSDVPEEERTVANSNQKAHVHLLKPDDQEDDSKLLEAMDTFVLTGAVKLYREAHGAGPYRHHTMLVHHAMKTSAHAEQAERVRRMWHGAGYFSGSASERLRRLFETNILPVSWARAEGLPFPVDYATLAPHVAHSIARIGQTGNPVLVVNSDKIEGEDIDFEQQSVWRILLGGNKLARGFTVEGLTVSYYRRMTKQADTLMQMGRWFGYRAGYRDLVRLYITSELYEGFEAICRDEEYFRDELRQYAAFVNGKPQVTPAQVPPLVASHLEKMKPTAANKRYNAVLAERRTPNKEPTGYPSINDRKSLTANTDAFLPILTSATAEPLKVLSHAGRSFKAWSCNVTHGEVLDALGRLVWDNEECFRADLAWLRSLGAQQLEGWLVVVPQLKNLARVASIAGLGPFSLHIRGVANDHLEVKTTVEDREAVEYIVRQPESKLGGLLLYPMVPRDAVLPKTGEPIDPGKVVMAFRLMLPPSAVPADGKLVTFVTRDRSRPAQAIVDVS